MSRQPSPGPSHFPPSAQHVNNRQKSKNYTQSIAAGAEDAKYKTKYRELKEKVKEIEMVSQPDAHLCLVGSHTQAYRYLSGNGA